MMDSGIPPINNNSSPQIPSTPPTPNEPPAIGPFAKMLPGASPEEVKKITNNFINYTIQAMKQDQNNMLEALKKMQEDQQDYS